MDSRSYIFHRIPKGKRKFREVAEPRPRLKELQKKILKWLMARRIGPSKYAHAFIKNRSIATHARIHVGKKVVVKMDIENFFDSIIRKQIFYVLKQEGLKHQDAEKVTEICTLKGCLPQGAPTSPLLSNLVFKSMDYRLASLARNWSMYSCHVAYSRYADDLVFSSDDSKLNQIQPAVTKILSDAGFKINRSKSRILRSGNRQTVTGLVVNQQAGVSRETRRLFRAELHNIKKALLEGKEIVSNLAALQGKAAFFKGVNPETGEKFLQEIKEIKNLSSLKEKLLAQTG